MKKVLLILLCMIGAWIVFTVTMLLASDRILVYGFRGLDNMFHAKNEFYACIGKFHVRVPRFAAELIYPPEKNNDYDEYRDDDTLCYYVSLDHSEDGSTQFKSQNSVEHSYDSKYVIAYQRERVAIELSSEPASDDIEADMLDICQQLYDLQHVYEPENDEWIAHSGQYYTIKGIMMYCHDDGYLLDVNDKQIYTYSDGKLKKIMNVPKDGELDYCIWKRK